MAKGSSSFYHDVLLFGSDLLKCQVRVDQYKVWFEFDKSILEDCGYSVPADYFIIPKAMIYKINTDKKGNVIIATIKLKDARVFVVQSHLTSDHTNPIESNLQMLKALLSSPKDVWAFTYFTSKKSIEEEFKGWQKFEIKKEWERQNISFQPGHVTPFQVSPNCSPLQ